MTREEEIRDEYINTSTYTDEGRAYQRVLEEVLDENQRLREALENVTHPINNLSSQDALEYHADVCKTVEEALEGDTK